jgi:hypothetical protein
MRKEEILFYCCYSDEDRGAKEQRRPVSVIVRASSSENFYTPSRQRGVHLALSSLLDYLATSTS